MSIYRDHAHYDVHGIRRIEETSSAAPAQAREPDSIGDAREEQYKHLRKAAPANIALPRTLTWVASLPPEVRPVTLLRQFPRIANIIAATWGDPKSFGSYMHSLMTDTRGKRRGFPAEVQRELGTLALQRSQSDFERRR